MHSNVLRRQGAGFGSVSASAIVGTAVFSSFRVPWIAKKNIKMAHRKNIQEGIRRGSDQRRAGDAREDDCEDGECKGGGGGGATACCCWVQ
jgi:hypothetical protein